jgi:hypothetical protein
MARLCATAPPGTNRAMYALPVKRMLEIFKKFRKRGTSMSKDKNQSTWIDFFFNPIGYIRKNWFFLFDNKLEIVILIIAGTAIAIDDIMGKVASYAITGNILTEIADKALFSWWRYWLNILINSSLNGIGIYFIKGWWFNIRLKFSGNNEADIKKCRSIAIYLNMIKSAPILVLIFISSLFLPNIYATYSNKYYQIFYTIVVNGMMIPLIYFEYRVAIENFTVDKKKLIIWFIYIPVILLILTIGLFIYGIVK